MILYGNSVVHVFLCLAYFTELNASLHFHLIMFQMMEFHFSLELNNMPLWDVEVCVHTHMCARTHTHAFSFSIHLLRGSRELYILVIVNTATIKMITNPSGVLTSSPLDI